MYEGAFCPTRLQSHRGLALRPKYGVEDCLSEIISFFCSGYFEKVDVLLYCFFMCKTLLILSARGAVKFLKLIRKPLREFFDRLKAKEAMP